MGRAGAHFSLASFSEEIRRFCCREGGCSLLSPLPSPPAGGHSSDCEADVSTHVRELLLCLRAVNPPLRGLSAKVQHSLWVRCRQDVRSRWQLRHLTVQLWDFRLQMCSLTLEASHLNCKCFVHLLFFTERLLYSLLSSFKPLEGGERGGPSMWRTKSSHLLTYKKCARCSFYLELQLQGD